MANFFKKIYMFFAERENWNMKMDTPIKPIRMSREEFFKLKKLGKI